MERRGFLSRAAAALLGAVAGVTVGNAGSAGAVVAGCCNLTHSPGSWSYCSTRSCYTWNCQNGGLRCQCCEVCGQPGAPNVYTASAVRCTGL